MINNKKAYNMMLIFWFIAILAISGLVISIGVLMFYSSNVDVRFNEATAMNNKIIMSISDNGYFNDEYLKNDARVTLLAGLSSEIIDSKEFFFNVTISNEDYSGIKGFVLGNPDFSYQCEVPGKYYAKCKDSSVVLLNKTNPSQIIRVRVITAVNQKGV
jgi:hypothetical protein